MSNSLASNCTTVTSILSPSERARFPAVARASFLVSATDPSDRFEDAFFPGVADIADAQPVDLTQGDANNVDFTLTPLLDNGRIEGVITTSYGLDQTLFVQVSALTFLDGGWVEAATTAADPFTGQFALGRLPGGVYRLRATAFELALGIETVVFFEGASTVDDAQDIAIQDNETVDGIEFALGPAAEFAIGGTVTDALGVPLSGIDVLAIEQGFGATRATTQTDASGAYQLAPLAPGSFQILFRDASGNFEPEYYIDAPTPATATAVVIDDADVSGIDAQLDESPVASGASGVVTTDSGPLTLAVIDALLRQDDGTFAIETSTVVIGQGDLPWELANLPEGEYVFSSASIDLTGQGEPGAPIFFDGVDSIDDATVVVLTQDSPATNINFDFTQTP